MARKSARDDGVDEPNFNIVIFGSAGSGKSSVINMLMGQQVAEVGSGMKGVTFKSSAHHHTIGGVRFAIHDTAGLDEGTVGSVPNQKAMVQLYELLRKMDGGVSLLIYCIPAKRGHPEILERNWVIFHGSICKKQVPIIILVTHAEESPNWFDEQADIFRESGIYPNGHACITSSKGKQKMSTGKHVYEEEYRASKATVERLILQHYGMPWRLERVEWVASVYKDAHDASCWPTLKSAESQKVFTTERDEALKVLLGNEAKELGRAFEEVEKRTEKSAPRRKNIPCNIVLFGDSDSQKASTYSYLGNSLEGAFRIYDAPALDMDPNRGVLKRKRIKAIYEQLQKIGTIHLLVHCVAVTSDWSGKAVPSLLKDDEYRHQWNLCYKLLCKQNVPIILLVRPVGKSADDTLTGSEWWATTQVSDQLRRLQIHPNGVAYVADDSQNQWDTAAALIRRLYGRPWVVEKIQWTLELVKDGDWTKVLPKKGVRDLQKYCGMDEYDAKKLGKRLDSVESDSD